MECRVACDSDRRTDGYSHANTIAKKQTTLVVVPPRLRLHLELKT